MKKKRSFLIQGIIRGLYYEIILLVIFYFSLGIDFIIGSFRGEKGFLDLSLFFDMWFINIVSSIFDCVLFLFPCLFGGILIIFFTEKLNKTNLCIDLVIHSLIYITGLSIVISITRTKIEFYSYDAIVYGLILLATVLFWVAKRNKQMKVNSLVPPFGPS